MKSISLFEPFMLHSRELLQANYERFVRRVIESETVWGLDQGTGFVAFNSTDPSNTQVILFWSDEAYAKRSRDSAGKAPEQCVTKSITLFDFLFRWLPGMSNDGNLAGCNWTADMAGLEINAEELQNKILETMPDAMRDRLVAELQSQINSQNQ